MLQSILRLSNNDNDSESETLSSLPSRTSRRGVVAVLLLVFFILAGLPVIYRMEIAPPISQSITKKNLTKGEIKTTFSPEGLENTSRVDLPEIAWLMSYPNSGTTYTLKLIQQFTNTTTATNYGNEQGVRGTSIPVHENLVNGPFYRYPDWDRPTQFLLTKTHCGGRSMEPSPSEYVETARSFEIACRSGNRIVNDTKEFVIYASSIPKRAIHLIRNPFDNVVARLHLEQKRWAREEKDQHKLREFNASKEGFQAWCRFQDVRSEKEEKSSRYFDDEIWEWAQDLPCHAEFMRYTWWHNLALETIRRINLPLHSLFYENYTQNWDETVQQMFEFLQLSPADGASPLEFIAGKTYLDYFEQRHVALAKGLVSTLASPESWALLEHYF